MNIVTQFPTNLNLNFANPNTERARRESASRELIQQTSEAEQQPAEKGLNSDTEKAAGKQQPLTYEYIKNQQASANSEQANGQSERRDASEDQQNRGSDRQQAEQENKDSSQQVSESKTDSEQEKADKEQKLARKEQELAQKEQQQIEQLKSRDREVKAHEQAHAAVGGQYAGSPSYEYQRGPDGTNYAIGGEVPIDVSKVSNDPQATIQKMQQVKAAALAPAEPSSQDRRVANEANQKIQQARSDLLTEKQEDLAQTKSAVADDIESQNQPSTQQVGDQFEPSEIPAAGISTTQDADLDGLGDFADFEPPQSLASVLEQFEPSELQSESQPIQTQGFSQAQQRIDQADEEVNARALRIQRYYNLTSVPNQSGASVSSYA